MTTYDYPFTETLLDRLREKGWLVGVLGVMMALLGGWLIGTMGVKGALITAGLPIVLMVVLGVLVEPRIGLYIYLNLSFLVGATRFLEGEVPVGTGLDGLLVLTLVSTFLNGKRMNWKRLQNPAFYLLVLWLCYTILEYFNPNAPYAPAWFYHARSFSLSWFLLAIIVSVAPITKGNVWLMMKTWLVWSVLAALWAFKQQYIGLTPSEVAWLASGADRTHILWGQLRSFSFYSDAGQFGSEMAGTTLVAIILFFRIKSVANKVIYLVLVLVLFWGFAVSGTRSSLFVILAGYPTYLVLQRKFGPIVQGIAMATPILAMLLFTNYGNGIYQIYRIRTALKPTKDESFLVRLENQKRIGTYMKDLPFGVGIGSSSGAGVRFSPNHWAAQIPPDSWYVQLWIETGIVGVSIYLLMLAGMILCGIYRLWQLKDPWVFTMMVVLLSEFIGIAVVSYSNPILGQFPTSTILYITSMLFSTANRWDTTLSLPVTDSFSQKAPSYPIHGAFR
ncbi:MAG: O-antigen ligase family protein [Rudanella sp.]|nr:O-antigen ligase family protein [Rudanella sp.]